VEACGIIEELIEIGTGKGFDAFSKRSIFAKALETAKAERYWITVAKFDHLGRNVTFSFRINGERCAVCGL